MAIEVCDLATFRSTDLSQYSGVITIEEPDTDDPFRTDAVPQLVLQFHDIEMTMLGYVEAEPEHIQEALTFARETDVALKPTNGLRQIGAFALFHLIHNLKEFVPEDVRKILSRDNVVYRYFFGLDELQCLVRICLPPRHFDLRFNAVTLKKRPDHSIVEIVFPGPEDNEAVVHW